MGIVVLRVLSFPSAGLMLRSDRPDHESPIMRYPDHVTLILKSVPHPHTPHHTFSGGMSIQRRSFQLCSPASASCTPLAPSSSVHLNGAPS